MSTTRTAVSLLYLLYLVKPICFRDLQIEETSMWYISTHINNLGILGSKYVQVNKKHLSGNVEMISGLQMRYFRGNRGPLLLQGVPVAIPNHIWEPIKLIQPYATCVPSEMIWTPNKGPPQLSTRWARSNYAWPQINLLPTSINTYNHHAVWIWPNSMGKAWDSLRKKHVMRTPNLHASNFDAEVRQAILSRQHWGIKANLEIPCNHCIGSD